MTNSPKVLIVEDDEDDFFLTERALRRYTTGPIFRLENGRGAIDYLAGTGAFANRSEHPLPDVVFLDLKMHPVSGQEVLAALRQNPPQPMPKIFVLTGSDEPSDRESVWLSGIAAGYLVKPLTSAQLDTIFGRLAPGAVGGDGIAGTGAARQAAQGKQPDRQCPAGPQ